MGVAHSKHETDRKQRDEVFALAENAKHAMGTIAELQRKFEQELGGPCGVLAKLAEHEAMLGESRRLYADESSRHSAAIAQLQERFQGMAASVAALTRAGPGPLSQQLACQEAAIGELQRLRTEDCTRLAEVSQLLAEGRAARVPTPGPDVSDLQRVWEHIERHEEVLKQYEQRADAQEAKLLEEVGAQQRDQIGELRSEFQSILVQQNATMKGYGDQLWVIDEQLWQTEKRLTSCIEELSQAARDAPMMRSPGVEGCFNSAKRADDLSLAEGIEALAFGSDSAKMSPERCSSIVEELHAAVCELTDVAQSSSQGSSISARVQASLADEVPMSHGGLSADRAAGERRCSDSFSLLSARCVTDFRPSGDMLEPAPIEWTPLPQAT